MKRISHHSAISELWKGSKMFITLQVITVVFYRPIARLFQGGGARLHCKEALSSYAVWDSAVSSYQCGVGQNASCKHFYAFRALVRFSRWIFLCCFLVPADGGLDRIHWIPHGHWIPLGYGPVTVNVSAFCYYPIDQSSTLYVFEATNIQCSSFSIDNILFNNQRKNH